jgi:transposase
MLAEEVFAIGLGLTPSLTVISQSLEMEASPSELHIEIGAVRGTMYPCTKCQSILKAHDYKEHTWRHLNFFQLHCYLKARVPRIKCPEQGICRVEVPSVREESRVTLLLEQVAMSLAQEMTINAVERHVEVTDNRLWRILRHYMGTAMDEIDLGALKAVGLDETFSRRRHNYITVFVDIDREDKPVNFAPRQGERVLGGLLRVR